MIKTADIVSPEQSQSAELLLTLNELVTSVFGRLQIVAMQGDADMRREHRQLLQRYHALTRQLERHMGIERTVNRERANNGRVRNDD